MSSCICEDGRKKESIDHVKPAAHAKSGMNLEASSACGAALTDPSIQPPVMSGPASMTGDVEAVVQLSLPANVPVPP